MTLRQLCTNEPAGLVVIGRAAVAISLAILAISGCAVGPNFTTPEPELPDLWQQQVTSGLSERQADLQTWWQVFEDPLLTSLIERAQTGNLDLRTAVARIDEAAARRGIARGDWFPDVDATADGARNRIDEETGNPLSTEGRFDTRSGGSDFAWELDFFGRVRRSVEASSASLDASIEDYRDVLVLLLSDVAGTYVDIRSLQARLRYAEENVAIQLETLELTQKRNRAGLVGALDVRQAELNLATTQAFVPVLRAALVQASNRLAVLIGEPPGALRAELDSTGEVPSVSAQVPAGVPADVMRRRPDVRRAERDLAAQTARIGVATADLYPRFTLLGSFSFDSIHSSDLSLPDGRSWGIGPSVRWNVFDGGRVRSQIHVEDARAEQAYAQYEQTVLRALQEVEDSLVAFDEERVRRAALNRSVVAVAEAVQLVNDLYVAGLTDFQNVLDTQRSLFQQQDALATSDGSVANNLIGVYRSLGGGWSGN